MNDYKLLDGIKVVELSTMVAAPSAGRVLADWGAEVIKVETSRGDNYRYFGQQFGVPSTEDENPLFDILNANKKSVVLDLKSEEGIKAFHHLLEDADVFMTNTRPKALKKLGIDYETLKVKYPKLIYALLSGFGEKGPKADAPGYDTIAFWATTGFLADMTVQTDGTTYPVMGPAGPGDIITGMSLLTVILGALYKRKETGLGDYVSSSLYGTALWCFHIMMVSVQPQFDNVYPRARVQTNPLATPFKTKDGEWIMTTILDFNKDWSKICGVLGIESLIDDPMYNTIQKQRVPETRARLLKIFEDIYVQKTAAEWMELLHEADIVHDTLGHFTDMYTCEQAKANEFTHSYTYAQSGETVLVRPSMYSEKSTMRKFDKAPKLGEHNDILLKGDL